MTCNSKDNAINTQIKEVTQEICTTIDKYVTLLDEASKKTNHTTNIQMIFILKV